MERKTEGKERLKKIMQEEEGAQRTYHFIPCDGRGYKVFADFTVPSTLADPKTGIVYGGYGGRVYLGWSLVPE